MRKFEDILAKKQHTDFLQTNVLSKMHHVLCREYGFIPLETLERTPIYTLLSLLGEIEFEKKEEKKQMDAMNKRR